MIYKGVISYNGHTSDSTERQGTSRGCLRAPEDTTSQFPHTQPVCQFNVRVFVCLISTKLKVLKYKVKCKNLGNILCIKTLPMSQDMKIVAEKENCMIVISQKAIVSMYSTLRRRRNVISS